MILLALDCSSYNLLKPLSVLVNIFNALHIIIPLILIIFIAIDFFKIVPSFDQDLLKKTVTKSVKRIISGVIVFFIPTIVGVINPILGNGDNIFSCFENLDNIDYYKELHDEKIEKQHLEALSSTSTTKEVITKTIVLNYDRFTSTAGSFVGEKYNLSDSDLQFLANLSYCEQGSPTGSAAEASLVANKYEIQGQGYSSIASFAKNGWFSCAWTNKVAPEANIAAVKEALVLGKRTLPFYIDEHDCYVCRNRNYSNSYCYNGTLGDICKIETNGTTMSSESNVSNHGNYKQNLTKVYTIYKEDDYIKYWIFYTFPDESSDPFGYNTYFKDRYDRLNNTSDLTQ